MSNFKFVGIHHAAFATNDIQKTLHYWRDLLGLEVVLSFEENDQHQIAFQISKNMLVFFFEWTQVEPVRPKRHGEPVKGPFIFDHLSIHLETEEELIRLQDQLVCADLPVSDMIDHGFVHSIYTFDPNGIPLEFSWAVKGVELENNPVHISKGKQGSSTIRTTANPDYWPKCEEEADEDRVILPGKERDYFK